MNPCESTGNNTTTKFVTRSSPKFVVRDSLWQILPDNAEEFTTKLASPRAFGFR